MSSIPVLSWTRISQRSDQRKLCRMDVKDLTPLINELELGKCILVLGPEAFLLNNENKDPRGHRELIIESSQRLQEQAYSKEDAFFYPNPEGQWYYEKDEITDEIKKYYATLEAPDFYNQLALLPFKLVISLSPDDLLSDVMDDINKPHQFLFYKPGAGLYEQVRKEGQASDFITVSDAKKIFAKPEPVIFNFMGHFLHSDSMVFTYEAMFEFMYSLSPVEDNFNPELMNAVRKAKSFLFIGFGYDKWYLKIIFFLFKKILGNNDDVNRKAIFNYGERHNDTVEVFSSQFKMKFFNESSVDFIVKTLYQQCQARKLIQKTEAKIAHYKILYFSSLPDGWPPLRFDKEYNSIANAYTKFYLGEPDRKNEYKLLPSHVCTTQTELIESLRDETPHMIIIALHANKDNVLIFQGENNQPEPLNTEELIKDIRLSQRVPGANLQAILFSCCNSDKVAEEVSKYLPNAIGMEGTIQDDALPVFCKGFFETFFIDQQIPLSVDLGKRLVEKQNNIKANADKIKLYSQQFSLAGNIDSKARV